MSEHLPECYDLWQTPSNCVLCDALRACEDRVTKRWEDLHGWGETHAFKSGKDSGWEDALYAAREAVLGAKAIDVASGRVLDEPAQFIWLNNALSAIDALREQA